MKIKKKLLIIFFLSGATGLIYQVLWGRILGTIFGNTTYAVSTVLAGFMAGLSLGSRYFGKLIDNKKTDLLNMYGKIAGGIGIYAALTPFMFWGIREIYKLIGTTEVSFFTTLVIFSLCFITIVIPTALMGGTLPILSKYFTKKQSKKNDKFEFNVGLLYSVNTFGAVVGAFLTGYILILLLGVNGSIYFAAAVNIIIAFYINRININENRIFSVVNKAKEKSSGFSFILAIIGISGLTAFVYEVTWTRVLSMVLGSSVYAFATMLSAFLTGIALGSFIYAKLSGKYGQEKLKTKITAFGYIQAGIGISVLLLLPVFGILPFVFLKIFEIAGHNFAGFQVVQFLMAFGVMLFPTTLFGITLPLACGIYRQDHFTKNQNGGEGESVGNIYASNTLGSIAGTLLAGFLLIPLIGLQKTITFVALINIILAIVLMNFGLKEQKLKRGLAITFLLFFSIPYAIAVPEWNKKIITSGIYNYAPTYSSIKDIDKRELENIGENAVGNREVWGYIKDNTEMLMYKEGQHFTVGVEKDKITDNLSLTIDGKTDASSNYNYDMITQILSAHLPVILHDSPRKTLVVGLASGVTLGSLTYWSKLKEIDCVEIEPAMKKASSYFNEINNQPLQDNRVTLHINDARSYLLANNELYDIIISEPSNPWMAGSASLTTRDYFKSVKNNLKEDGVFCMFLQMYKIKEKDYQTVINTLDKEFKYISLWQAGPVDSLIIAGNQKNIINYSEFEKNFKVVEKDLSRINIAHPMELLSRFIAGSNEIDSIIGDTEKINTDNKPYIEFAAAKNVYNLNLTGNVKELLMEKGASVSNYMEDFNYNYELASAYIDNGNILKAETELHKSLEKEKKVKESLNLLGFINLNRNRIETAKEYFNQAIQKDDTYIKPYINLARAYTMEKNNKRAESVLKEALKIGKRKEIIYNNLGNIYNHQEKYEQAISYFRKALEINPNFSMAYINLGVNYLENRNNAQLAIQEFKKALEISPDSALAHYHLGRSYLVIDESEKAQESFTTAVKHDPSYMGVIKPAIRPEMKTGRRGGDGS